MLPASIALLYALSEAADAYEERMTPLCAAAGLTLAQFNLLFPVVEEEPMRLSELAKNRRCVKSNVSYLVRTMEKDGLLKFVADTQDRRVRRVQASPKGLRAYRKVLRQTERLEREARTTLGEKTADNMAKRLMQIAKQFDGK